MRIAPLLLLAGCTAYKAPEAPVAAPVTTQVVGVTAIDGPVLAALLRNESTRPMLVNFWATWCGPCVSELPLLDQFAATHSGVNLLLVSVDDPSATASVDRFVRDRRVRARTLHLADGDPSSALHRVLPDWPDVVPVTLLVAPGGSVLQRFVGVVDEASLSTALAGL